MTFPVSDADPPRTYRAAVLDHNLHPDLPAATLQILHVRVRNEGDWTWRREPPDGHPVLLALRIDGTQTSVAASLESETPPHAAANFAVRFTTPVSGPHRLTLDLVHHNVAYFSQRGSGPLLEREIACAMQAPAASARLKAIAQHSPAPWTPTEGVTWSRSGPGYPAFTCVARGSRCVDEDGREQIDWVMGWGANLLGYASPPIHAAVADAMTSAALPTLPSDLELELGQALCELFPGAERVLLGKNGSDITTAAVRLARARTGKPIILYSGYHGWQDWNHDGGATCAPPHAPAQTQRLPANDCAAAERLFATWRGQIAAVMIEPAAQIEGVDGPVRNADPTWLRTLRDLCHREQALLVFDEIFTGFRWPHGSVQRATGVVPDLTCLGKALAAGFPLAALLGSADAFAALDRIGYSPTFRGERLSCAAALAALSFFRAHDVPAHVQLIGTQLRDGIDALAVEYDVPVHTAGLPIRLVPSFATAPAADRTHMRTLVQQVLLQRGVLSFRGFLLPSFAHGEREVVETLGAFRAAFVELRAAKEAGDLVRRLEIPLIA